MAEPIDPDKKPDKEADAPLASDHLSGEPSAEASDEESVPLESDEASDEGPDVGPESDDASAKEDQDDPLGQEETSTEEADIPLVLDETSDDGLQDPDEEVQSASDQSLDAVPIGSEASRLAQEAGVDPNKLFSWDIKASDVLYVLNRHPFLQIVDSKVSLVVPSDEPELILSRSGWQIYDYGNALSTSAGLYMYGGGDFSINEDDDEAGGGTDRGIINPGKGTLINQAYITAMDMIRIADERMWEGLLIVDGHPLMQWAAWAEAYDRGFIVEGYEPDAKAFAKRERIRRSAEQSLELRDKIRTRSFSSKK